MLNQMDSDYKKYVLFLNGKVKPVRQQKMDMNKAGAGYEEEHE